MLGSIGSVYQQLEQPEEAIHYYEQSIAIAREIGNKSDEGFNWEIWERCMQT